MHTAGNTQLQVQLLWNKIAKSPIVSRIEPEQLKKLFSVMELTPIKTGEWLARSGQVMPTIYLIVDGMVEAEAQAGPRTFNIRNFSSGDLIGDSALLENKAWPADYKVTANGNVFKLNRDGLLDRDDGPLRSARVPEHPAGAGQRPRRGRQHPAPGALRSVEAKMALLPIRLWPDPVLRAPASKVEVFDDELARLVDDMVATMYSAPGVGLAAPQVGVGKRVAVVDVSVGREKGQLRVLVNPRILEKSGSQIDSEGCLSIPEFTERVERPERILLEAQDRRRRTFRDRRRRFRGAGVLP